MIGPRSNRLTGNNATDLENNMKKRFICIAIPALGLLAANTALSATVPAGAVLVVRTLETITSVDTIGTRVPMELTNNVAANGKVVLPAGTKLMGKVTSSRKMISSNARLKVDLTAVTVGGRSIPVKTTGASQLDNNRFKTRNDVSVSRAGYAVPAGRVIQYHLAQPIQL